MIFLNRHHLSVTLAVIIGVLFVTAAASATTSLSTNISTDGSLTVNGSSTFGDAAADVNLFTGTLQASTTALFTSGLTTYGNITLGTSGTTTILLPGAGTSEEVFRVGLSDTETYGYGLVWKYDANEQNFSLGIRKIPDVPSYALDISGTARANTFSATDFTADNNATVYAGLTAKTITSTSTLTVSSTDTTGTEVIDGSPIYTIKYGSGSLSFGNIGANSCADATLAVLGIGTGTQSLVTVSPNSTLASAASSTVMFSGWVSADATVTVRACQVASQGTSPLTGTVYVVITSFAQYVAPE